MDVAVLRSLVQQGKSIKQIARVCGLGTTTVRYWLTKHGLKTTTPRRLWTDASMVDAIKTSVTISDVLKKVGLTVRAGNYGTVRRFAEENGISLGHMQGWKTGRGGGVKVPLNEVLVSHSFYNKGCLKRRLLKAGLLEYHCYATDCPNPSGVWRGKNLVLVLDHINGDTYDNRIENLRLLCPNCDSQQVTYRRKYKSRKSKE